MGIVHEKNEREEARPRRMGIVDEKNEREEAGPTVDGSIDERKAEIVGVVE